jgi:hypothetical protein
MSHELPDSISPILSDAASKQEPSAASHLDADRVEELPPQANTCTNPIPSAAESKKKPRKRQDHGHLHSTRHAVLSRFPLETLRRQGESVKQYRAIERQFREALKPTGVIALMLFDRFFSCYLRCILAARFESGIVVPRAPSADGSAATAVLHDRAVPTLIFPDVTDGASIAASLPPDLLRELVLVQRYDRHFNHEMMRTLCLLLAMRDGGEDALRQSIELMLGAGKR